jgi:hypothetical protein
VLPVALVELLVQIAFADRYGYHRDELYFRTAAQHPAAGYDDQGPLTPLLGWLSESVFGESPRGLRIVSCVAVAVVVVVVAVIGRELGAGAVGQLVAASGTAVSAYVLTVGHLLSTTTFDLLVWVVVLALVCRLLDGGDPRLWLAVGVTVGLGLQNKQLPLLLVAALAIGLAIDRRLLGLLRSPWLWLGVATAFGLWLPNLLWQATNGWPQADLARDIRADEGSESRVTMLPFQILLLGPLLAPIVAVGLWGLLRSPSFRPWRSLAYAYVALLGVLLAVAGKPYYAAPFLLCLLAAGSVPVEHWLTTHARRALVIVAIGLSAVLAGLLALPIVPADKIDGTPIADVNEDAVETIGWPELVRTVARVFDGLSAPERRTAVIFTGNYGEAGAVDRYGPELGLPRAYSAHNAYARFGVPPAAAGPVIVLGHRDPSVAFVDCREVAMVENDAGVDNEERGGGIFLCERPRASWDALWPLLTHLDA